MDKNTIRPYEMSIWTLRDSFLATLKAPGIESKGHIQEPKLKLNIDGTQELTFKVPMYYFKDNAMIENPYWYDLKHGLLLVDMRKIKLIFNKGSRDEEVYEFVVTEAEEKHEDDGSLFCEVVGSGLSFQELGKKGYKISLSEDDYYNDMDNYYDALDKGENPDKPINNINYWCDKVFKNLDWTYSIQMDWSDYDGILYRRVALDDDIIYYGLEIVYGEDNKIVQPIVGLARVGYATLGSYEENIFLSGEFIYYQDLTSAEKEAVNEWRSNSEVKYRLHDKIYEDEYVTSWEVENSTLVPVKYENFKEKCRIINEEESNVYNLTQALAEQFGVYCKYQYHYDDNYHIIGKEVIFYNSFVNEFNNIIDLNYGYNASSITRKMDGNDLCTKLIVKSVDDDSSALGTLSIMNSTANPSGEDYLLNFDYMHNIGTIDDDQYEEVSKFEAKMHNYNNKLTEISEELNRCQNDLTEEQANLTIAINSINQAIDQRDLAIAALNSLTNAESGDNNGVVSDKLETHMAIPENDSDTYYINLSIKGITSITLYNDTERKSQISLIEEENIEKDEYGYIIRIYNINKGSLNENGSKMLYSKITYNISSYYREIIKMFSEKQTIEAANKEKAEDKITVLEAKINRLEEEYETLLNEKEIIIADFEKMMGPALREGYWQPDEYDDYGDTVEDSFEVIFNTNDNDKANGFFWDNSLFDDEQNNCEKEGVNMETVYYPFIIINDNMLSDITSAVDLLGDQAYLLSFRTEATVSGELYYYYFNLNSTMSIAYLEDNNNNVFPILLLEGITSTEKNTLFNNGVFEGQNPILCISSGIYDPSADQSICTLNQNNIFSDASQYTLVYPRYFIEGFALKNNNDEIHILNLANDKFFEKYYDYSVLTRDDGYYITFSPEQLLIRNNERKCLLKIEYILSNAELNIFLDAREVLKTNSIPQVSYEIEIAAINTDFMRVAYKQLNHLVHINDFELKFENVKGYISNLELELDKPWEDTIEIKNYKTKFEDLFSKIVASSEQLKANATIYDKAASAFTKSGILKEEILQNSVVNSADFSLVFNKGKLVMNETSGLLAESSDGVVAFSGGGIFCATERDDDNNWKWHTGIVPSGINAALINAGQLNTNLIRIYSGDNLRFQMNGDGLFAYKDDDQDQYVVHNEDGLFLVDDDLKKVEVSWDGLIIRSEQGNVNNDYKVFYADTNGNLTLEGNIIARGGKIANWIIGSDSIYNKYNIDNIPLFSAIRAAGNSNEIAIAIGANCINDDISSSIWETAPFTVKQDGSITATKGIIAGWEITTGSFVAENNSDGTYIALNAQTISEAPVGGYVQTYLENHFNGYYEVGDNIIDPETGAWYALNKKDLSEEEGDSINQWEYDGLPNNAYAFWAGNKNPNRANFSIQKNGSVFIRGKEDISIVANSISATSIYADNLPTSCKIEKDIIIYENTPSSLDSSYTYLTFEELQLFISDNINDNIIENDITILIHSLPQFESDDVTILTLENAYGPGSIIIKPLLNNSVLSLCALRCINCQVDLKFSGLNFHSNSNNNNVASVFDNCSNVICTNCSFIGNNNSNEQDKYSRSVLSRNSNVILERCSLSNSYYLISAEDLTHMFIKNQVHCSASLLPKENEEDEDQYNVNSWLYISGSIVHTTDIENNTETMVFDNVSSEPVITDGGIYSVGSSNNTGGGSGSGSGNEPVNFTTTITRTSGTASGTLGSIQNSSTWNSYVKVVSPTIPYGAKLTGATVTITRDSSAGLGSNRPISEDYYHAGNNIGGGRTWNPGKTHTVSVLDNVFNILFGSELDRNYVVTNTNGTYFTLKLREGQTRNQFTMGKNYSDNYMKISCYITVEFMV